MASLYHLQINVSDASKSFPFYKDLFQYLGYTIIDEDTEHIGFTNGSTDFWLIQTEEKYKSNTFNRKNTGINHIAFKLDSKVQVDIFANTFLKLHNIPMLYSSPKLFPEYSDTYYAVYFEDPDRIKLEVMCK